MRKDLDNILAEKGAEALLLYAESYRDANMYYLTKFLAPDRFILLKRVDSEPMIVINSMEYPRAQKESIVRDVRSYMDYNYLEVVKSGKDLKLGGMKFIASVAEKELGKGTAIYVPPNFPTFAADVLRKEGLTIEPMFDVIEKARETKDSSEVEVIKTVQMITEKAVSEAIDTIAETDVDANQTLISKVDGRKQPLTVRKVKSLIGHKFLDQGIVNEEEAILACGPPGADPHYTGNPDDKLKANTPIIMDVFPRSERRRYWSDMTRTIVKGRASDEVKKMFNAVYEAKNASMDALHAGVLGNDVNDVCCDVLEKAGFKTIRGGKRVKKGFIHGLGHGVGLQIHEGPSLSELYKFPLEENNIVTIEPGLYDPAVGGVRIEDIVEVTKSGCNNLTTMETCLEI
ncbi:MAG: aminopeptidase P family protein [Candidatus Bathyarchaeota archaeon]|nr:MAG: aminopeptidase P family protein [Candidatus Bathyarchaeota archaeon]